jgi:hypothetical protein
MIEPTVGRVDGQEEVATLHGANIPLAAYLHEIGSLVPPVEEDPPLVVWRDVFSHWRSVRGNRSPWAAGSNARIYDAYWRFDDPMPGIFNLLGQSMGWLRKKVSRVPPMHRIAKSSQRAVHSGQRKP